MPKTKIKTTQKTATTADVAPTFAEFLLRKKSPRAELLKSLPGKQKASAQLVGILTAGVSKKLLGELRTAAKNLDCTFIEVADLSKINLWGLDVLCLPAADLETDRAATEVLACGTVPVVCEQTAPKVFAENYDPTGESGNSFFFAEQNVFSIFAALVRARESYRFSYDWRGICRNVFETTRAI